MGKRIYTCCRKLLYAYVCTHSTQLNIHGDIHFDLLNFMKTRRYNSAQYLALTVDSTNKLGNAHAVHSVTEECQRML